RPPQRRRRLHPGRRAPRRHRPRDRRRPEAPRPRRRVRGLGRDLRRGPRAARLLQRQTLSMNLRTTTHPLPDLDADLVALVLPAEADAPDAPAGLRRFADDAKATGEPVLFYDGDRRWAVLRLKDEKDEPEALRTATARLAATAAKLKAGAVALALPEPATAEQAAALVEGFVLGGYRFRDYKTGDDDAADVQALLVRTEHGAAAEAARIRAESAC